MDTKTVVHVSQKTKAFAESFAKKKSDITGEKMTKGEAVDFLVKYAKCRMAALEKDKKKNNR